MLDYAQARRFMVDCQLRTVDVNDVAVLDAFTDVPRERFVTAGREDFAYIDQDVAVGRAGGEPRRMLAPAVLALVLASTIAATYGPARSAASTDPAILLRAE